MSNYKVNNRPVSIKAAARKYYIRESQIKMYKAHMNKKGSVNMSASDTVEKRCDFPQKLSASPRKIYIKDLQREMYLRRFKNEIYGASSTFLTSENESGNGSSASETGATNPEDYAVSKSKVAARTTVTNGRRLAKAAYRKNVIKRRSTQQESINMYSGHPIADISAYSKDQARGVAKRDSKKEMVDSLSTNRSRDSARTENLGSVQADPRRNEIKSDGRKYAKGKLLKEKYAESKLFDETISKSETFGRNNNQENPQVKSKDEGKKYANSKLLERKYVKSMPKVNFSESKRTKNIKYKDAALTYARKSYSRAAISFDTKKVCRKPTLRSKKFSFRNLLKGNAFFKRLKEAALSKVMLSSAGTVVIICILIVVLFGAGISYFGYTDSEDYKHVSIAVEEKADYIRSCAKDEEILNYEELIKAVVMVETSGENVTNAKIDAVSTKLALCIEQVKPDSPVDIGKIRQVLQKYYAGDDEEKSQEFVDSVLEYYPFGRYTFAGGNGAIVEVAKGQLGNVGGRPFWSWYGFSEHVEWCACFVSWCEDKCGYLDSGKAPKFAAVGDGISWFKSKGQWKRGTITPESGMIIFFDWERDGSPDHVGIVEKVETGTVWTIEGNSGDKCREMSYSVGSSVIYGYGVILK